MNNFGDSLLILNKIFELAGNRLSSSTYATILNELSKKAEPKIKVKHCQECNEHRPQYSCTSCHKPLCKWCFDKVDNTILCQTCATNINVIRLEKKQ